MNRTEATWPVARAGEALAAMAAAVGAPRSAPRCPRYTPNPDTPSEEADAQLHRHLESVAARCQADLHGPGRQPGDRTLGDGPRLIVLGRAARVLVSLGHKRGRCLLLTPGGQQFCKASVVSQWLSASTEDRACVQHERFEQALKVAGCNDEQQARALEAAPAVVRENGRMWAYRLAPHPGTAFGDVLRQRPVRRAAQLALVSDGVGYVLFVGSWFLLGQMLLRGVFDRDVLLLWSLALASTLVLRALGLAERRKLIVGIGVALKRRLLLGGLQSDPQSVRSQGVGRTLGSVIDAQHLEQALVEGTLTAILALFEIVGAIGLVVWAGGAPFAMAAACWLVVGGLRVRALWRAQLVAARARVAVTGATIEQMLGRRTRAAQCAPERWHEAEDASLAAYASAATDEDDAAPWISRLIPRGWLLTALGILCLELLWSPSSMFVVAAELGASLLLFRALVRGCGVVDPLMDAGIRWRRIAPLLHAATKTLPCGLDVAMVDGGTRASRSVLALRDVGVRYEGRSRPVLDGVTLDVARGEKLLVEGPSGAGKSTVARLFAGVQAQTEGAVALHGLDYDVLGAQRWHHRVAWVPQFHDNHLLAAPLLFNLLLGRAWPPRRSDVADARRVCEGLGLGPLLERMPSGIAEFVGERGWQLSHGEKSRVFLARAVLAKPEVAVFDESFAALDPNTLHDCVRFVAAEVETAIVIAHP